MPPASVTQPLSPDAGVRSSTSLWRLRGYLRPHTWSLVVMLVAALLAVIVGRRGRHTRRPHRQR